MDDVPAGPASPEPQRLPLAVVIPVHNGGRNLERCLLRLRDSQLTDYELIVVDDGSTDGSGSLAGSLGARVVRHDAPLGPAAARNAGVLAATAPVIFFLDSDVAIHPEALGRALARFEADPGLSALFGSYDDDPPAPGLISQYRNLLHHYVHQQGRFDANARPARTFWTGCGAIRRQAFLDLGGFDRRQYRQPTIEDIEFGYRLTRAGCRIVLARDVQATHLKRWTLGGVVLTDIFRRGVPWMLLIKRSGVAESDLNVRLDQKLSVAAVGVALLAALAAPWLPRLLWVAAGACIAVVGLNRAFYRFLARRRGRSFAVAVVPLHFLYFACCGLSVLIALALWHLRFRRDARDLDPATETRPAPAAGRRLDPAVEIAVAQPTEVRARRPSRWIRHRP
jgi:hypothetical protein